MPNWTTKLKATFDRAFPERQIYHRSGGTVRYISVSPWQQVMMAAGVTAILGWTAFATGNFLLSSGENGAPGSDGKELARYERWVQELRAREALSRSLLEERTKETADLEEKQRQLEEIFNDMREDDGLKLSALKGDGASLLIEATIDDADARESRDSLLMTATLSVPAARGTPKAIRADIDRLASSLEDYASERSERARGVLQLTSIGEERIRTTAGMGGPEISLANFTSSGSKHGDTDFLSRLTQARARIAEMKYYEKIVKSLPLGKPVAVPYRFTSPYGMRIDPFTKRPAPHMGIDLAAYRDAPIVSSGPGEISFAGQRAGYGILVEVDHGHGFKSRYGHLRSITVSKGDTVKTGDLIGRMGSTGRSTGDHLHYEVWFNGKPYDPVKFLKAGRHVHKE